MYPDVVRFADGEAYRESGVWPNHVKGGGGWDGYTFVGQWEANMRHCHGIKVFLNGQSEVQYLEGKEQSGYDRDGNDYSSDTDSEWSRA